MLAARALNVQRIAARRGFATAVTDAPHGVKVAALDFGQPSSAVTIVAKAGSRFQSKEGVANALKNFAFKVSIMCLFFCDSSLMLPSPLFIFFLFIFSASLISGRALRNARLLEPFGRPSSMVDYYPQA